MFNTNSICFSLVLLWVSDVPNITYIWNRNELRECIKEVIGKRRFLKMKKISKSDFKGPVDIVISPEIKLRATVAEKNYWKTRYELLKRYKK
jgi:hypothetical protein